MSDSSLPCGKPVLRLPCYEPSALTLELDAATLLKGVLITGSIGSGKTSLLSAMLSQLIHHRAAEPQVKLGLLVLDAKHDGTAERIQTLAAEAGRAEDVLLLPSSSTHFPLFECLLERLSEIPEVVKLIEMSSQSMGPHNAWWEQLRGLLLEAALTLYLIGGEQPGYYDVAEYLSRFFIRPLTHDPEIPRRVEQALDYLTRQRNLLSRATQSRLRLVLDQVRLWLKLDDRTRGNVQATLVSVLAPMVSTMAEDYFAPKARAFDPASVVEHGKILVASCNAATEPALARFLFRVLKRCFYRAVQARPEIHPDQDRLVGLVMDEWPLCASADDVVHLQTVRARGAFHLVSLQGLATLDESLGQQSREALLVNLNTFFFLRSHERELDEFAWRIMGNQIITVTDTQQFELAGTGGLDSFTVRHKSWHPLCPPGTLSRLQPHQAWVSIAGQPVPNPVWPVPLFVDLKGQPAPPGTAKLVKASLLGQSSEAPALVTADSLLHYHRTLYAWHGLKECTSAEEWFAASLQRVPSASHDSLLEQLVSRFRRRSPVVPAGLETLPATWLAGLAPLLTKLAPPHWEGHWAWALARVQCAEGLLLIQFAQFEETLTDARVNNQRNQLRLRLQLSLFPNPFRPLRRNHRLAAKLVAINQKP
jgi:hypothetical protein